MPKLLRSGELGGDIAFPVDCGTWGSVVRSPMDENVFTALIVS